MAWVKFILFINFGLAMVAPCVAEYGKWPDFHRQDSSAAEKAELQSKHSCVSFMVRFSFSTPLTLLPMPSITSIARS